MRKSDDLDDETDFAFAAGNANGRQLADIYRTEAPRLVRFFRRRLKCREEAQDLMQEAFARFAGSKPAATLRNPEAYLQRIARNILFDLSRRAQARSGIRHVPLDMGFEVPVAPEQAHAIEAQDVMKQYRKALSELTPKTREVFLLHRVEELSYKEIADRLGISVHTVEYHMVRALVHIDKALDRN